MKQLPTNFFGPMHYNALICRALGSTKSALLLQHLIDKEAQGFISFKRADLENEVLMTTHEVNSSIMQLMRMKAFVDGSYTNGILKFAEIDLSHILDSIDDSKFAKSGHLLMNIMTPIEINRTLAMMFRAHGFNINHAILMTLFLREQHPAVMKGHEYTDWFKADYTLWQDLAGLTENQIRLVKKNLSTLNLLESGMFGMPAERCHRVNLVLLNEMTDHYLDLVTLEEPVVVNRNSAKQDVLYPLAQGFGA
ncbi:hypothetical protein [Hydromonas duriensis]|uniref:Uncharacterized protein n=1 Tax=Hydromonas duriensis TaxID=1527608 RepID=A0A4R6Y558_9BURK|nr:hypothetical protein [Hydromonas duriensis]TDR27708.1 hypothetical protein DFR44_1455 [Hydromonas duriensis]